MSHAQRQPRSQTPSLFNLFRSGVESGRHPTISVTATTSFPDANLIRIPKRRGIRHHPRNSISVGIYEPRRKVDILSLPSLFTFPSLSRPPLHSLSSTRSTTTSNRNGVALSRCKCHMHRDNHVPRPQAFSTYSEVAWSLGATPPSLSQQQPRSQTPILYVFPSGVGSGTTHGTAFLWVFMNHAGKLTSCLSLPCLPSPHSPGLLSILSLRLDRLLLVTEMESH